MTDKKFKLWAIIIATIIVVSAAANIIYASNQVIAEPLFLAINKETVYNESFKEKLSIAYISNNKDERRLESIRFEGLEALQYVSQTTYFGSFNFNSNANNNPYNDSIGRYYTMKWGYIELELTEGDLKRLEEKGGLTIGQGSVNFNDGTSMELSLGRITISSNEHWDQYRIREGAGGGDNHFEVDFKTKTPMQITSIDLSSFEPHQEALDMALIVDQDKVYTYGDLSRQVDAIPVDRSFQVSFTAKDQDASSQWRFSTISMDMTYEKEGQSYETWLYFPFYGTGMDEASVEAYIRLWRSKNE